MDEAVDLAWELTQVVNDKPLPLVLEALRILIGAMIVKLPDTYRSLARETIGQALATED